MTCITYIDNPRFEVDFKQFCSVSLKIEDQKAQNIASSLFHLIAVFTSSAIKASCTTLRYSGTSFKHIVLGFHGSWKEFRLPKDIHLVVFKVAFWILSLGWCATTTAIRLSMQELFPSTPIFLAKYAMQGINIEHIRTNEIAIDMSRVEAPVRVDDLMQIYDAINFDNQNSPGYMAPLSRTESHTTYSVEELRKSLEDFIKRVKNREAFLGTPPHYDTFRLMTFYQQIENAVRFSIDASNKQIASFQEMHGKEIEKYDERAMKTYSNLLEDRARIAIDLAIAGKHCGARYLGEAMVVYKNAQGDGLLHKGSLQDCIIELLARKRYEIATAQIQGYLGINTHSYNKYMANLGKILALPGTENIIEYLDNDLNREKYLKYFFEAYTIDVIIDTIQEEFKKSQLFREKITDWIKDQVADWQKNQYQAEAKQMTSDVLQAMSEPFDVKCPEWPLFSEFIQMLQYSDNISLPKVGDNWGEFLDNLFNLEGVKQWRDNKFPDSQVLQQLRNKGENIDALDSNKQKFKAMVFRKAKIEELKALCLMPLPSSLELAHLKVQDKKDLLMELSNRFQKRLVIEKVRKVIDLEVDTLARIIVKPNDERKKSVEEAILSRKDLDRRNEFLAQIAEKHIIEKEVKEQKKEFKMTPEMIEWLTVSQGIFNTQDGGVDKWKQ